jgi:hypothetical protein
MRLLHRADPLAPYVFHDSYEVYGRIGRKTCWKRQTIERVDLADYMPEFLGEGDTDLSARVIADYRRPFLICF